MKRFSSLALAVLAASLAQAAPVFQPFVPQQLARSDSPNVIEGHRFAINLNKLVKAEGKPTFRWAVVGKPPGATVIAVPDPSVLDGRETPRDIVGFEVDRAGNYTVSITATDKSGSAETRVTVEVKNPLQLLTKALPPAVAGQPYEMRFFAQGGTPPYTFALEGALPAGLEFRGKTLAGTPGAVLSAPAELELTVTDAAGLTQSQKLALRVAEKPLPWGMLNIGSSFTPHDDPLRAAARHLGWDQHGWRLDRGGTLGVGIGYTWNNDLTQRWRMLDAARSGQFASLFLHQGRTWGGPFGPTSNERGELTDLGALKAFFDAARETSPRLPWPVYFLAYWRPESDVSQINATARDYFTNGDVFDDTALYYEGSLRQAYEASRLIGRPVYLIPQGPVMFRARRLVADGKTPSLSSVWDLFAGDGKTNFDGGHFSELGNTIFAQTYFAQTYRLDPRTLPFVYKQGSDTFVLATDKSRKPSQSGTVTPAEAQLFQSAIHDVLTSDPFSGFQEPASLDAYLATMRERLGWWETFDVDLSPIKGDAFTGENGRRWTGRSIRRNTSWSGPASIEILPGGELSTTVDKPFDLLFVETSLHHREEWALEILAGDKVIGALPRPVETAAAGSQVAQWYLKDLRAKLPSPPFTLTLRNTGKRALAVDNLKLRTAGEHGWILGR